MSEPYSAAWHRDLLQAAINDLAQAIDHFLAVDREDVTAVANAARRIERYARSVSAETGALLRLSSEQYQRRVS